MNPEIELESCYCAERGSGFIKPLHHAHCGSLRTIVENTTIFRTALK